MKKISSMLLVVITILFGCNETGVKNQPIIESVILNQSTYEEVKKIIPDLNSEWIFNEDGLLELSDTLSAEYTINDIVGKLSLRFNDDTLAYASFSPQSHSKELGEELKTWLFEKYKNYEQTTKDTGFVFSNGSENVELYMTENPIDNTKYHGLYIEWTITE